MGRVADVRFAWRELWSLPQARRARGRTLMRLAAWGLHCVMQRPAVIRLRRWDCRLELPAGRRRGTTAVYLFREAYEPELAHLEHLLGRGDVFVDAGASVGLYTVVASRLVGESGRVLAFEPASVTLPVLRRNVELNALTNVLVLPAALSDRAGQAMLHHVGGAPHYSLGGGEETEAEAVTTTTLDGVVVEERLPKVSCMKIDVEGAEELVLRGAAQVLRRDHPTVIFEVNHQASDRLGLSPDGAIGALRAAGYTFRLVGEDGATERMVAAPNNRNILACP